MNLYCHHSSAITDAPAHLKKELDTVLSLQGDLDTVENVIEALAKTGDMDLPKQTLKSLRRTHECLKDKVEELYASLNVQEAFPELADVDLEFVQTFLWLGTSRSISESALLVVFLSGTNLTRRPRVATSRLVSMFLTVGRVISDCDSRHETTSKHSQGDTKEKTRTFDCDPQVQQILRNTS